MTHLTSDELIDALEGNLPEDRQAHLSVCASCERQRADLASVFNETKQAGIPEPSPLFWQHLSENVNAEIDKQLAESWPQWMRWQVLLPLGAIAMIILALMISVPKSDGSAPAALAAPAAPAAPADIDHWVAVAELVGDFDLDAAAETGVIEPGLAEQAVLELTAEEQAELTRLLQAELRAKS